MRQLTLISPILTLIVALLTGVDSWAALTESGSINDNNGLYVHGDNWADANTSLTWTVFHRMDGNFEYDYTFALSGDSKTKKINQVIIQVSNDFTDAEILNGTTPGGTLGTYDGSNGKSNIGIPGPLYGIKWDLSGKPVTSLTWRIVTDRAPLMGNFYVRNGNADGGIYAYSGTGGIFGDNVAVPEGVISTPIMPTVWLLGAGLIGLAGIRKLRPDRDIESSTATL